MFGCQLGCRSERQLGIMIVKLNNLIPINFVSINYKNVLFQVVADTL